jgi:putative phosphoesterase
MRIAVISDSHDNIWKLDEAMPHLRAAQAVIHCGDICSPFMIRRLGEGLKGIPVHVVWGNNDGDKLLMTRVARDFPDIELHGEIAELELGGLAVAVNHYPAVARGLAHSGKYRLVCYGHDHQAHDERVGECLLLNPGELMGLKGVSRLALVDSDGLSVERVLL